MYIYYIINTVIRKLLNKFSPFFLAESLLFFAFLDLLLLSATPYVNCVIIRAKIYKESYELVFACILIYNLHKSPAYVNTP